LPYLLADGLDLGAIERAVTDFGCPWASLLRRFDRHRYRLSCQSNLRPGAGGSVIHLHPLVERIYQTGCYGRKTGAGYFDYSGENPSQSKVMEVIRQFRQERGSLTSMEATEIMETLLALGINEQP